MKYFCEYKGIYFIEGDGTSGRTIGPINIELNGFFSQNQLKTLDDLKDKMVQLVKRDGGNAVISFKYGQRSTFWKSIFGMDDVYWYGSGVIAQIDPASIST